MSLFRPCIDIHQGQVKQIVGGSLIAGEAQENFVSDLSAADYAKMYQRDQLEGGHVIMLGAGNQQAAEQALAAWPAALQVGGGINLENAKYWLDKGASKVIVTSALFNESQLNREVLMKLSESIGKDKLVIDLSCRRNPDSSEGWVVTTNRWQTLTQIAINEENLDYLAKYCDEFLIHAADVEGLKQGADLELVSYLAEFSPIMTTYAGGIHNIEELKAFEHACQGKLDYTIGSALDIFGGEISYTQLVANHKA